MEILLIILNVHVKGYIQSYRVYYNQTHEHKGTQWGGGDSYVKIYHQKVHQQFTEQDPPILMSLI